MFHHHKHSISQPIRHIAYSRASHHPLLDQPRDQPSTLIHGFVHALLAMHEHEPPALTRPTCLCYMWLLAALPIACFSLFDHECGNSIGSISRLGCDVSVVAVTVAHGSCSHGRLIPGVLSFVAPASSFLMSVHLARPVAVPQCLLIV